MIYDDLEFDGTNDIRIDPWKIRECEMHSIQHGETIRQISLFCSKYPGNTDLYDRIDSMFQFAGLYPHVMKRFDILPYDKETAEAITESGRKMMEDINTKLVSERLSKKYETAGNWIITDERKAQFLNEIANVEYDDTKTLKEIALKILNENISKNI
ncbi:MAG: hypothetical protein WC979_00645 [Candidatus Pacearchaeota archaeon]|jgi:hypothetical protein|nr:hypothetical protein [Clostridia bacterium]